MYTDKFELAFKEALYWEGGYVNHPNDPGSYTKWEISQKSYPNLDIKNLTIERAKQIYFCDFWKKIRDCVFIGIVLLFFKSFYGDKNART